VAELRYNNQSGLLGSLPLSSGGTTITFAVAPNFATLTSGQFIKLVLDAGTSNFEVVYLTAYTSGQTTGTISRAAEDSTNWPAVSHTSTSGPSGGTATWACVPTATGQDYPGESLISSQVLASTAASVTFSSIPNTYNHLKLVAVASANGASYEAHNVTFNGDSGSHYDHGGYTDTFGVYSGNDGAASHAFLASTGAQTVNDLPPSNSTLASYLEIKIPYYNNTTFYKAGNWLSTFGYNWNGNGCWVGHGWAWRSTAAITSIALAISSGSYAVGSAFYLYGIT
jgi:hypothetical protein